MDYGWIKNVKESITKPVFEAKVNLCDECYNTPFPFGIIYDGEEAHCPHLFALKAKEKL